MTDPDNVALFDDLDEVVTLAYLAGVQRGWWRGFLIASLLSGGGALIGAVAARILL